MESNSIRAEYLEHNKKAFSTLLRITKMGSQSFSIVLARCNYAHLRTHISHQLTNQLTHSEENHLEKKPIDQALRVQEVVLRRDEKSLYDAIKARIQAQIKTDEKPEIVIVHGLETITDLKAILTDANQVRDRFPEEFPFPILLWTTDKVLASIAKVSPDFRSWAGVPVYFKLRADQLVHLVEQKTNDVFQQAITLGAGRFPHNLFVAIDVDQKNTFHSEIKKAILDLEAQSETLNRYLTASLLFMQALYHYSVEEFTQSQRFYQESLEIWDEIVTICQQQKNRNEIVIDGTPYSRESCIERAACTKFYLGIWWRRMAVIERSHYEDFCQQAETCYVECLALLHKEGLEHFESRLINALGEVVQRILYKPGNAKRLEDIADKSIALHRKYHDPIRLAYSCCLKAEALLETKQWEKAETWTKRALRINSQPSQQFDKQPSKQPNAAKKHNLHNYDELEWAKQQCQSLYLLTHARAKWELQQHQAALSLVSEAKELCNPSYDPPLYVSILETQQDFFTASEKFLNAFLAKQEQRAIKQQYGLCAFVGANRLQAEKQVLSPAFIPLEVDKQSNAPSQTTAHVSSDQAISVSGRQKDIKALVGRLSEDKNKLVVLHGPSGVGKSSTISAGLVPKLHQSAIGPYQVVPILLDVYTSWESKLVRRMQTALAAYNIEIDPGNSSAENLLDDYVQTLKAYKSSSAFYTIFIFDQLEELFFFDSTLENRKRFWKFIEYCCNTPFFKVVFSLREDYLHKLLEFDQHHVNNSIANDILSADKRYALGNFSISEAKDVISSLTARSQFHLEPALIDQVAQDLALNLGEIRPIELQVVGVQLQENRITTLEQYQALGKNPKTKLVEAFLEQIIQDCGAPNQDFAELILYLLTDEKGIRPLRTRGDLIASLQNLSSDSASGTLSSDTQDRADLVLEILVKSGLVILFPDTPAERYQLVHDYLVSFIRQRKQDSHLTQRLQQMKGKMQRQRVFFREKMQRQRRVLAVGGVTLLLTMGAATATYVSWRRAMVSGFKLSNEIVDSRLASGQHLEALKTSIQSYNNLHDGTIRKLPWPLKAPFWFITPHRKVRFVTWSSLIEAIYTVKEKKRFSSNHTSLIQDIVFSRDGNLLASAGLEDGKVSLWDANDVQQSKDITHCVNGDAQRSVSIKYDIVSEETSNIENETNLENTLCPEPARIQQIAFSPSNNIIASVAEGHIFLFSYSRTSEIPGSEISLDQTASFTVSEDNRKILNVAFSLDGQSIAVADDQGKVTIRSLTVKREGAVNVSPQATVIELPTDSTKPLRAARQRLSFDFSPDGESVLIATGKSLYLFDSDGQQLGALKGNAIDELMTTIKFSEDGKLIATGTNSGKINLWRKDLSFAGSILAHDAPVKDIQFVLGSRSILSMDSNSKLNLSTLGKASQNGSNQSSSDQISSNRTEEAELLRSLSNVVDALQPYRVSSFDLHLETEEIAVAIESYRDQKNAIQIWNLEGIQPERIPRNSTVTAVEFSHDGQKLAIAEDFNFETQKGGELVVIDVTKGFQAGQNPTFLHTEAMANSVADVSFGPEDKVIAIAENIQEQGQLSILRIEPYDKDEIEARESIEEEASKDIQRSEKKVLLELEAEEEIKSVNFHPQDPNVILFSSISPNENLDAFKSTVSSIDINNCRPKNCPRQTVLEKDGEITVVHYSPDGQSFLTATNSSSSGLGRGYINLWDIVVNDIEADKSQRTPLKTWEDKESDSTNPITDIESRQKTGQFISTTKDGTIKIWDSDSAQTPIVDIGRIVGQDLSSISISESKIADSNPGRFAATAIGQQVAIWQLDGIEASRKGCLWLEGSFRAETNNNDNQDQNLAIRKVCEKILP